MTTYKVTMSSSDYGIEDFEYDTLGEAYEAVSRLALAAAKLNDGIARKFYVIEQH